MNTKLRIKANNELEKDFFTLMHDPVFGKEWRMLESSEILN